MKVANVVSDYAFGKRASRITLILSGGCGGSVLSRITSHLLGYGPDSWLWGSRLDVTLHWGSGYTRWITLAWNLPFISLIFLPLVFFHTLSSLPL